MLLQDIVDLTIRHPSLTSRSTQIPIGATLNPVGICSIAIIKIHGLRTARLQYLRNFLLGSIRDPSKDFLRSFCKLEVDS
jgi:hypothetical protein